MAERNIAKVFKVFNDPIHGHIEMHPLLVKIIDTPHFQRLRNIKQLGPVYYVFPGASHNRFEHSIGVAHLAGKLVKNLHDSQEKERTPEEKMKEQLCVQIAGLCHDLGHGPFSHLFEKFMKTKHLDWTHEKQGIKMFKALIEEEEVKEEMNNNQITEQDIKFIEDLIVGKRKIMPSSFLHEIVNNSENGIDVDKMDYFSRDCHHLGLSSNFSHERYMVFAQVCTEKEREHISMRDKEALNMYELFHVRNILHHNAYQHRVVKSIDLMILDALTAADATLKFSTKAMVSNVQAYQNLTDYVFQEIFQYVLKNSKDSTEEQGIKKAAEIIENISRRKLYRFIDEKIFPGHEMDEETVRKELKSWLESIKSQLDDLQLSAGDFDVQLSIFNYGMKDKNPIESLLFYTKDKNKLKKSKDEVSYLLLERFAETKVMVLYKGENKRGVLKLDKDNIKTFWKRLNKFKFIGEKIFPDHKTKDSVREQLTHWLNDIKTDSQLSAGDFDLQVLDLELEKYDGTKVKLFYKGENECVLKLAKKDIKKFWERLKIFKFVGENAFPDQKMNQNSIQEKLTHWLGSINKDPQLSVGDFIVKVLHIELEKSVETQVKLFCMGENKCVLDENNIKTFWDRLIAG